jgi:peptidoglycan/LPS O-acetylase OafA/YrhL
MRGIAAIVVLVFHAYLHHDLSCFKNSHLAVDFFFVLSGFVIFHSYAAKIMRGMTFQEYAARRIGRLYPLMVAGILLGAPVFYLKITTDLTDYIRRDFVVTMLTNLFMLPYITAKRAVPGVFPTDPSLWSIAFEMLASLSFPLLLKLNNRQLTKFCLAWLLVLAVSSLLRGVAIDHQFYFIVDGGWSVENIMGGFPRVFFGFACGMLLCRVFADSSNQTRSINPWFLYAGLVAALLVPVAANGLYALFFVAVLSPLTVWLGAFSVCHDRFTLRLSEFLGWLSYPLYCLHRPVLQAVQYLDPENQWSIRFGIPEPVLAIVLALIVAVLGSYLVQQLQLQQRLTNFLQPAVVHTETA